MIPYESRLERLFLCVLSWNRFARLSLFRMAKDMDFFQAVYEVVRLIPPGKVTTYGAIAQALGSKGAARMVGWAMNASHSLSDVPPFC